MSDKDEIEYYRSVLEQGLHVISDAFGVSADHYDIDQADGECYLDCFKDAADVIRRAGIRWVSGEAGFSSDIYIERLEQRIAELEHMCAELGAALKASRKVSADAFGFWNTDQDSKVGKILRAMSGDLPRYRNDIDSISTALAKLDAMENK